MIHEKVLQNHVARRRRLSNSVRKQKMFGLVILFVIGVYILIALVFITRSKGIRNKLICLIIFILIPTWDILPQKLWFYYNCSTGSELIVHQKAKNLGIFENKPYGFYNYSFPNKSLNLLEKTESLKRLRRYILMHRYRRFIFDNDLFAEVSWQKNGAKYAKLWVEKSGSENCLTDIPRQEFIEACGEDCIRENTCIAGIEAENNSTNYTLVETKEDLGLSVVKVISKIENIETQEVLVEKSKFYHHGNWVYRIIAPRQAVASCGPSTPCLSKEIAKAFYDDLTTPLTLYSPEEHIFCSEK